MAKDKKKQAGAEQGAAKKPQGLIRPPAKGKETPTQLAVAVKPGSGVQKSVKFEGKKKKQATEIDAIFGSAAARKAGSKEAETTKDVKPAAPQQKVVKVAGSKDDIFGHDAGKGRKKTEEGWNVYTEDELGLGKRGGDTDLCPFDCDCCF